MTPPTSRPPFSAQLAEAEQADPPLDYDALLRDRDGWKRIADERWRP